MRDRSANLVTTPRHTEPETPFRTASPQFPGVDFQTQSIDFNTKDAEENELAIRSSLIYFKHRWPGETCVLEGPKDFRIRAWRIAEELGVPVRGPRPGNSEVATRNAPPDQRSPAHKPGGPGKG